MRKIGSPFEGFGGPFGSHRQAGNGTPPLPAVWITDGSIVEQAPDGPTVIWSINGSNVSYTEV